MNNSRRKRSCDWGLGRNSDVFLRQSDTEYLETFSSFSLLSLYRLQKNDDSIGRFSQRIDGRLRQINGQVEREGMRPLRNMCMQCLQYTL